MRIEVLVAGCELDRALLEVEIWDTTGNVVGDRDDHKLYELRLEPSAVLPDQLMSVQEIARDNDAPPPALEISPDNVDKEIGVIVRLEGGSRRVTTSRTSKLPDLAEPEITERCKA